MCFYCKIGLLKQETDNHSLAVNYESHNEMK